MSRALLLVVVAVLVAACGGGDASPAPRPVVAVYGDSLASGHLATPPGRLAVPPARRLQEMLGEQALVVDYAQPGARVADALAGAATMPLQAFAEHVRTATPDVVVLRFGGADALLGTPPENFARDVAQLVALARAEGAAVVLVGLPHHPAHERRLQALDAAAAGIARAAGLPWVDLLAVPAGELADGTHPSQGYADALVAPIAAEIIATLARPPP